MVASPYYIPDLGVIGVRHYRKGDTQRVGDMVAHGDPVLTVDPGAHGMALLFPPAEVWPGGVPPRPMATVPLWGLGELEKLADCARAATATGHRLMVVIEESYAGGRGNAATDLQLARFAGAVLGAIDVAVRDSNLWRAAFVMPASWLSALGRIKGKRKDRKVAAYAHAVLHLGLPAVDGSGKLAQHREAYCDAYGIATWWGKIARTPLRVRGPASKQEGPTR